MTKSAGYWEGVEDQPREAQSLDGLPELSDIARVVACLQELLF
jgi:hypothetical protein